MNEYTKIPSDKPVLLILIRPNSFTVLCPIRSRPRDCTETVVKKLAKIIHFGTSKTVLLGGNSPIINVDLGSKMHRK